MNHKYIILIIISPLILSLPVDETLYKQLKENAKYEIIDYNELFQNNSNSNPKILGQSLEYKLSILLYVYAFLFAQGTKWYPVQKVTLRREKECYK